MEKTLFIIRGVSGSGKTTFAKSLAEGFKALVIAADDFFYKLGQGEYAFDARKLGQAHGWCQNEVRIALDKGEVDRIIVHNTFTTEGEIRPYVMMAKHRGWKIVSLIVENRHGNNSVHGVPEEVRERQSKKLMENIKLK